MIRPEDVPSIAFGQGDLWIRWAVEYVRSGKFESRSWLRKRWITCDEAVFRFGVPRMHVIELAAGRVDGLARWRYPADPDQDPLIYVPSISKKPLLAEKQNTRIARSLQRAWGLSHILPTSWQRILR